MMKHWEVNGEIFETICGYRSVSRNGLQWMPTTQINVYGVGQAVTKFIAVLKQTFNLKQDEIFTVKLNIDYSLNHAPKIMNHVCPWLCQSNTS